MRKIQLVLFIFLCCLCGCSHRGVDTVGEKLFYSIQGNDYEAVKECLSDKKLDLENLGIGDTTIFKNKNDKRALALAMDSLSTKDGEDIPILLIKKGAKVSNRGDNTTYLREAALNGNIKLVKALVEHGANVNEKEDGKRVLDDLAQNISPENEVVSKKIIKYLIEKGAKVDATVMKYSLDNNCKYLYTKDVLQLIKKKNEDTGLSRFLEAAIQGNNKFLKSNIEKQKMNKTDQKNILLFASANCDIETIEYLRKQLGTFHIKDENRMTPTHIAALCNNIDVLKYFIENKVNGDKIDFDIISLGASDFALLSSHKAKYNLCIESNMTSCEDSWEVIGRYGSSYSLKQAMYCLIKISQNDINMIFTYDNELIKRELLKRGYYPKEITYEMITENDMQLIDELYQKGSLIPQDTLNYIVDLRENVIFNKIMKDKKAAYNEAELLYHAVKSGNLQLVQKLSQGNKKCINQLVEDDEQEIKITPFQEAASCLSENIVKVLLKNGGDLKSKDDSGRTPYKIAKENGIRNNMEILK